MQGMSESVRSLSVKPEYVVIDGNRMPKDLPSDYECETMVKGDAKVSCQWSVVSGQLSVVSSQYTSSSAVVVAVVIQEHAQRCECHGHFRAALTNSPHLSTPPVLRDRRGVDHGQGDAGPPLHRLRKTVATVRVPATQGVWNEGTFRRYL